MLRGFFCARSLHASSGNADFPVAEGNSAGGSLNMYFPGEIRCARQPCRRNLPLIGGYLPLYRCYRTFGEKFETSFLILKNSVHGDSTSEGKIKGREECGRLCFLEWVSIGSFFVECDLFDGIWVGQESIKKNSGLHSPEFSRLISII